MKQDQTQPQKPFPHYWGFTSEQDYYTQQAIKSTSSYFTTPTGHTLFTRSWHPLSPPRGIICMVHGYGNDISWTFQATPIFLAQNGFSCFALDLPGHGKSDGLKGFVPDVDEVVECCNSYFCSVVETHNSQNLPVFLFGESMGGAICLLISLKFPTNKIDGTVLIAPMCKISDGVRPKWPIPEILTFVGKFMPTLPIVPTPNLLDKSIKVADKRAISVMNPLRYNGRPRLGTVIELLRVTDYLSQRLCDVTIPFIVLHGEDDVVTDPNVSRSLFEASKSHDKSIKIYPGMLHSLLFGETDENVELVRRDILGWLNDWSKREQLYSG